MVLHIALALAVQAGTPAPPPLCAQAPRDTIAWLETDAHVPLLAEGLEHPLVRDVLASPLAKAALADSQMQPAQALGIADAFLGTSVLETLGALTDGGLGLGIVPGAREGDEPLLIAVLQGADPDRFDAALEAVLDLGARFDATVPVDGPGFAALASRTAGLWRTTDEKLWLARLDDARLVLATDARTLTRSVVGGAPPRSLEQSLEALGEARQDLRAWINLELLDAAGELDDLRAMTSDPGAHFVLGPALTHFGAVDALALRATFSSDAVEVLLQGRGGDAGEAQGTFPGAASPSTKLLAPGPREVARAVLHRDVDTLLDRRIELFRPKALPGIAEGLANLALIAGGPDAVDELVDALGPRVLVVAEEVTFEEGVVPDIPLPATAVVLEIEGADPEISGARLVQAFQSIVSLQNVERSMQGKLGFLLGLEAVDGVTMTTAKLPRPRAGDGVDLGYNFAPACAVVGRRFVVGTHHDIVRGAIERLSSGRSVAARGGAVDRLELRGEILRKLVAENRDVIEMNAVLQQGKPRKLAALEVDALMAVLERLEGATFQTNATLEPALTLDATLRLELGQR